MDTSSSTSVEQKENKTVTFAEPAKPVFTFDKDSSRTEEFNVSIGEDETVSYGELKPDMNKKATPAVVRTRQFRNLIDTNSPSDSIMSPFSKNLCSRTKPGNDQVHHPAMMLKGKLQKPKRLGLAAELADQSTADKTSESTSN